MAETYHAHFRRSITSGVRKSLDDRLPATASIEKRAPAFRGDPFDRVHFKDAPGSIATNKERRQGVALRRSCQPPLYIRPVLVVTPKELIPCPFKLLADHVSETQPCDGLAGMLFIAERVAWLAAPWWE